MTLAALLLRRFSLRHWRLAPGQNAMLVFILALGVGVFVAIRLANRAAVASFSNFTDVLVGQSDWIIEPPDGTLPESVLPELRAALGDRPVTIIPVVEATGSAGNSIYTVLGLDLVGVSNLETAKFEQDKSLEAAAGFWSDLRPMPRIWVGPRAARRRYLSLVIGETPCVLPGGRRDSRRAGRPAAAGRPGGDGPAGPAADHGPGWAAGPGGVRHRRGPAGRRPPRGARGAADQAGRRRRALERAHPRRPPRDCRQDDRRVPPESDHPLPDRPAGRPVPHLPGAGRSRGAPPRGNRHPALARRRGADHPGGLAAGGRGPGPRRRSGRARPGLGRGAGRGARGRPDVQRALFHDHRPNRLPGSRRRRPGAAARGGGQRRRRLVAGAGGGGHATGPDPRPVGRGRTRALAQSARGGGGVRGGPGPHAPAGAAPGERRALSAGRLCRGARLDPGRGHRICGRPHPAFPAGALARAAFQRRADRERPPGASFGPPPPGDRRAAVRGRDERRDGDPGRELRTHGAPLGRPVAAGRPLHSRARGPAARRRTCPFPVRPGAGWPPTRELARPGSWPPFPSSWVRAPRPCFRARTSG